MVIISAVLIVLEMGKNLITEIDSAKLDLSTIQINTDHSKNQIDIQKSYEVWLERTSGGRKIKESLLSL